MWWNREQNQINPLSLSESGMQAETIYDYTLRETGRSIAVIPHYQRSQDMWWYNLLNDTQKALVRAIAMRKEKASTSSHARAALEYLVRRGFCLVNRTAYYNNALEEQRHADNTKNHHSYVYTFLCALGVPSDSVPTDYRPLSLVDVFVVDMEVMNEKCTASSYLDVLAKIQGSIHQIVAANKDIVMKYYNASRPWYPNTSRRKSIGQVGLALDADLGSQAEEFISLFAYDLAHILCPPNR